MKKYIIEVRRRSDSRLLGQREVWAVDRDKAVETYKELHSGGYEGQLYTAFEAEGPSVEAQLSALSLKEGDVLVMRLKRDIRLERVRQLADVAGMAINGPATFGEEPRNKILIINEEGVDLLTINKE